MGVLEGNHFRDVALLKCTKCVKTRTFVHIGVYFYTQRSSFRSWTLHEYYLSRVTSNRTYQRSRLLSSREVNSTMAISKGTLHFDRSF